jgi:Flp pilus assembly protein TadG
LVEFALCIPVLLIFLTAIIQFGLMFNQYITLNDAVRAGARTLSLGRGLTNPCDPAVAQVLTSASGVNLPTSSITVAFSQTSTNYCGTGSYVYNASGNTTGNETQGDQASMSINLPYTVNVFGLGVLSVTLHASASDGIE